ncbi:MAG: hypothetical protein ACK47B_11360 [Armatimonadota bacterium]
MTDTRLKEERRHATAVTPHVEEPLPITVVPDWEQQVQRAGELCRLVDRHLDYEARGRLLADLRDFRPQHLCPEQRVQMVSDCYGGTR